MPDRPRTEDLGQLYETRGGEAMIRVLTETLLCHATEELFNESGEG